MAMKVKKLKNYELISHFFKEKDLEEIYKIFTREEINWNLLSYPIYDSKNETIIGSSLHRQPLCFGHTMYMCDVNKNKESFYDDLIPETSIKKIVYNFKETIYYYFEPTYLLRMRACLYPKTEQIEEMPIHTDYHFNHASFLLNLNTNNGYTRIGDEKIPSIENTVVLFNGSSLHTGSTCSDKHFRLILNFNWI